jgi:curved DNA-binding protein CbpA
MTPHKKAAETTAPEIEEEDIYVAVGVERTASAEEIKKAYRKQALR